MMAAYLSSLVVTYALNALWQIPLLYLAALLVAPLLRRVSAVVEHRLWVGALGLAAILPACHFAFSLPVWRHARAAAGGNVRVTFTAQTVAQSGVLRLSKHALFALALVYGVAMAYFAARLVWGLYRTNQLRRRAEPIEVPEELQGLWASHAVASRTRLAVSDEVFGPVVLGVRTHWLLMPPDFLTEVKPKDMESALAHEFAHIERRDFSLNLLYEVLALPIDLHPVTHVLRARIAETREIVCDTLTADAMFGRQEYAHSLLRLAALVPSARRTYPLHAIGIFDANTLERRITVMTTPRIAMTMTRRIASFAACLMLAGATCGSAVALSLDVKDTKAVASDRPLHVAPGRIDLVHKENPVYPAEAKANNDTVDGACVLHLIIDETGTPTHIAVAQSLRRDYDIAALEAVKNWRWQPYLLNGKAVAVDTMVTINYSTTK